MKDRVPLYPGRVKLVPVSGQENVYDMTRADQPTQTGDPLNKATLLKDATAALFGLGADSVPDDVLALLSKAALYKPQKIGSVPEGSVVYLNENGYPVPFYIAKHNYESSLNPDGNTLLVRKNVAQRGHWDTGRVANYDGSDIDVWFNGTYFQKLDSVIRSAIKSTVIRYTPVGGSTEVSTISKKIFALSIAEIIGSYSTANIEGSKLPIADTLKLAELDSGESVNQFTRTPYNASNVCFITSSGEGGSINAYASHGYRPAFTLPSDFILDENIGGLYDVSDNLLLKLPGVQIATGSYVGTGTYGADNPNSLTFEFEPKVVIISTEGDYTTAIGFPYIWGSAKMYTQRGSFQQACTVSVSGNTMNYYSNSDEYTQMNTNKQKYPYIAIG